jgi:hypothetical protein
MGSHEKHLARADAILGRNPPAFPDFPREPQEPGPVPTLRELFQMTDWVWAYCTNGNQGNCHHQTALRLQPFADRWGWNASSDLLRERLVCKKCGGKGAQIVLPSRDGLGRMKPFPIA